jgi:tRNA threonylcarbamoyladenosine biosynthesis protein TsaB
VRLLAIDTATEACSVALLVSRGGTTEFDLLVRELDPGAGHSERILPLVQEILGEGGVSLADLSALAFGRGPGAFTGVRLAASVAQGLAFGAGLGVVPVSDLSAVAQRALDLRIHARAVLVCNDARMQEVYWSCCSRDAQGLAVDGVERVGPPETVELESGLARPVVGAGSGFSAYPALHRLSDVLDSIVELLPRAREIAVLAHREVLAGRILQPEQALPHYIRDNVARASHN